MPDSQAKASPLPFPPLSGASARKAFRRALGRWFQQAGRDLPWRKTTDPYAILVSELMLQQTQVATVLPFFARWMARFPNLATLAAAPEQEVLSVWQGLGYYARARHLQRAAQRVVAEHGGTMPAHVEALRRLPGVGDYTAGAVASFAFDAVVAAVDANIARVLARLFNVREPIDERTGREAVWEAARLLLPEKGGRGHNSALMELGALICLPRTPQCPVCPVRRFCAAERPELLPAKRERRAVVALEEHCGWVQSDRGVLLEQQSGSRWNGLWKLPSLPPPAPAGEPLWVETYPFTHHRVTLRVYPASLKAGKAREWFAGPALEAVALAAAHRRAVTALLAHHC